MATLNQIKVNTGTEENPSYVLHDVHDKRLDDGASSLVTTCTHLLATNAALSSFNPITSANLASVLGATTYSTLNSISSLSNGMFTIQNTNQTTDVPTQIRSNNHACAIMRIGFGSDGRHSTVITDLDTAGSWKRVDDNHSWVRVDNFGCNTPADLASLLGGLPLSISRGLMPHFYKGYTGDIDNINEICYIAYSGNIAGHGAYGILETKLYYSEWGTVKIQRDTVVVNASGPACLVYERTKWPTEPSWCPWVQLTNM